MMGAGIAYSTAKAGIDVVLKDTDLERPRRARPTRSPCWTRRSARAAARADKRDALLARIHSDRLARRPGRLRPGDRGGVRGRRPQAPGARRDRAGGAPTTRCWAPTPRRCRSPGWPRACSGAPTSCGLHFFSPVDKMPLVEIIVGEQTSDAALAQGVRLRAGHRQDADRGRRLARLLHLPGVRHAGAGGGGAARRGLQPGVDRAGGDAGGLPGAAAGDARRADPDAAAPHRGRGPQGGRGRGAYARRAPRHGRGRPDGRASTGAPARRPARASTTTRPTAPKRLWPGLWDAFGAAVDGDSPVPFADMQERMTFAMAIETQKCLDEGVLRSTADANIGSILGIGFPPLQGGAVQYVRGYEGPAGTGVAGFVARAERAGGGVRGALHPAGVAPDALDVRQTPVPRRRRNCHLPGATAPSGAGFAGQPAKTQPVTRPGRARPCPAR